MLAVATSGSGSMAMAAAPGPTVPFQDSYPITVAAGDYDLLYLVLDFAPGAGIPLHFHGGPAAVVGMEGELTLRPLNAPEHKLMPFDPGSAYADPWFAVLSTWRRCLPSCPAFAARLIT
jgi:hypothetical protein